jgi:hypothetical protein
MNKTTLILILFLLLLSNFNNAQEVISSSGSSFNNSTNQLSWTLGETITETFVTDQSILTQGFQQSKLTVTAINQISVKDINLKVYPNPVSEQLNVEVGEIETFSKIYLSLFDINGKLLIQKKMEKSVETIDMLYLIPGSYLLTVCFESDKLLQTFKVIKIE